MMARHDTSTVGVTAVHLAAAVVVSLIAGGGALAALAAGLISTLHELIMWVGICVVTVTVTGGWLLTLKLRAGMAGRGLSYASLIMPVQAPPAQTPLPAVGTTAFERLPAGNTYNTFNVIGTTPAEAAALLRSIGAAGQIERGQW